MKKSFKELTKINNVNYMEFVNQGEDSKVIEFFSNLRSLRVAKQNLIKIVQYLEQTGEEGRSTKYLNKAEEIGLRNIAKPL
ncbi:hypothetical protein [Candidatus Trichorickettsia mobilis]|uniref:hypothetical protein n=1 Tax=Candidatus Trichorickettsia mobilis TaxID=1346319 RepID=UPI00292D051D|nr:hypothetical protein [Candidatus Trichorickettsia mobilis]